MYWILGIIAIIVLFLAIELWYISVPILVVAFIGYKIYDASEQRRIAEEAEKKRLEDEAESARSNIRSFGRILSTARERFASLEEHLSSAHHWLNEAEVEFADGAFSPFWDAMENATNSLGACHEQIGEITVRATNYEKGRLLLTTSIPDFDVLDSGMPDPRPLASRLSKLCRAAQKDFHFATIYEQRKTNQLLYSGFGTLAAGLARMNDSITEALDELSTSLGTRLDDLLTISTSQVEASSKHYTEAERQAKMQSEMLDNIQRGKKPPEGTLDRVFHYHPDGDTRTPHDVSADD